MRNFEFLRIYRDSLPNYQQDDFHFKKGKSSSTINNFSTKSKLVIPDELENFYRFSYGAVLDEYNVFTIGEIKRFKLELIKTYKDLWQDNILPFAEVVGVGDCVAFDLSQSSPEGLLIVDGFHEIPPAEWKGICFGLENWLRQMVGHNFQPFWLSHK